MNIITDKPKSTRLEDGINTILGLSDEDFDYMLSKLQISGSIKNGQNLEKINFFYTSDPCELPENSIQIGIEKKFSKDHRYIERGYFVRDEDYDEYTMADILKKLYEMIENQIHSSKKKDKIQRLLESRGYTALQIFCKIKYGIEPKDFDRALEILDDDSQFREFKEGTDNRESVLRIYAQIFGRLLSNHEFVESSIFNNFYMENMDKYIRRYVEIYDLYNLERYTNPFYKFKNFLFSDMGMTVTVRRKDDEPNWQINPELIEFAYNDMPKDISLEEKAIYIYGKLCQALRYDQGYFYRSKLPVEDKTYEETFSKGRLEQIKPGSKITCFDFSRIFAKFLNDMNEEIEAVIILLGANKGHSLVGFYTNNMSVMADAINEKNKKANDLFKVKNGMDMEGIKPVSDRKGILKPAIQKVSRLLNLRGQGIQTYISTLEKLPRANIPSNLQMKLYSFIQMLQDNGLKGNEAVQSLLALLHLGFFGKDVSKMFLGKSIEENGKQTFKRLVAMYKGEESSDGNLVYLFDSEELRIDRVTTEELWKDIKSEKYVREESRNR